jgi:hypothetical protein
MDMSLRCKKATTSLREGILTEFTKDAERCNTTVLGGSRG